MKQFLAMFWVSIVGSMIFLAFVNVFVKAIHGTSNCQQMLAFVGFIIVIALSILSFGTLLKG